jgi:hypothetical protein
MSGGEVKYEGYELVEGEGFMQPKRYKIGYECGRCNRKFSRTFKAIPAVDPPCPSKSCSQALEVEQLRKELANLKAMIEDGRAPAQVGANVRVKAVDMTADMVMKDHHLTDLRDNIREGEIMAPKLPPVMQKAADGFFAGDANKALGTNKPISQRQQNYMKSMTARAIGGAFRDGAVAPNQVLPKDKPRSATISNPSFSPRNQRH